MRSLERHIHSRRRSLILSNRAVPTITLRYKKLKEITDDIDDARVYGGIHSASNRIWALIWDVASASTCSSAASLQLAHVIVRIASRHRLDSACAITQRESLQDL